MWQKRQAHLQIVCAARLLKTMLHKHFCASITTKNNINTSILQQLLQFNIIHENRTMEKDIDKFTKRLTPYY